MAVPPQSQQAIAPQSANSTSETDHNTAPAAETITLLENRLRRLEFALTGDASSAGDPTRPSATSAQGKASTVAARLGALEEQLRRLKSDSPVVGQVLELCESNPHRLVIGAELISFLNRQTPATLIFSKLHLQIPCQQRSTPPPSQPSSSPTPPPTTKQLHASRV